jgi:hypothetical protein
LSGAATFRTPSPAMVGSSRDLDVFLILISTTEIFPVIG